MCNIIDCQARNSLLPHYDRLKSFCWTCSDLLQQICREEAHLLSSADLQVAVHLLTFLHHNLKKHSGKTFKLINTHIEQCVRVFLLRFS